MRRKAGYLIVFLLIFCASKSWAQYTIVPSWGGGADQNDLSFGFTFQYVNSDFKIVKKANWQQQYLDPTNNNAPYKTPLTSISSNSLPGFGIGFVTRYSITDHLEIRTTPQLVFADKELRYTYQDSSGNITKQIQTTSVDIPLSLKLKSDRMGDFRFYVLGGVKTSFAINKKPDDTEAGLDDKKVKLTRNYNAWEAAIGCDIYFEYFKLSPELKVSNSFNNVLMPESHPYSSPISKLFLHTISFSLYFE
ncbi:outer membrane beta-barrel protein [Mucilaginibacter jinjuensis]|uniref:Outer membrane beta-barrel protein n=1 Tax=Mucilaginibacter jinjuensis TaxID=1176721 RepID=A0ABY7TD64_9SPHI|nr:outer membrane beta-barrel protein [Mucilaginibacter jinjuensis]WCT13941.1 outer membrane beta-barrel protein [Mucilaginibacter jinjuensis]